MDDGGHRENGRHRIDCFKGVNPQVKKLPSLSLLVYYYLHGKRKTGYDTE